MTHSADEQISYRLWPYHLAGKRGDDGRQPHLFLLPPDDYDHGQSQKWSNCLPYLRKEDPIWNQQMQSNQNGFQAAYQPHNPWLQETV